MRWKLRSSDLVWQVLDGEAILLDLRSSRYLRVNGSGVVILEALGPGSDVASLTRIVFDEFEVDADQAERDVTRFLTSLREADLIVEVRDGP